MVNKKTTFPVTITLKNGFSCEHQHANDPEPQLYQFLSNILKQMTTREGGILTLPTPYGIYRIDDISGIIFHVKREAQTPRLGFHPIRNDKG